MTGRALTTVFEPDGWYPPDAGPTRQQEPVVARARWVLHATLGDDDEAGKVMQREVVPQGWPAVNAAMAAWCDQFTQHTGDPGAPPGPVQLSIDDPDPRPHVRWAIELVTARAGWDRLTWQALLAEVPPTPGGATLYVNTVLHWVTDRMRPGQIRWQATRRHDPQVPIDPVQRGQPHPWRQCRLKVSDPATDPDRIVQQAIDIVWEQELSASQRRLIHGYLCHRRRDAASRQVFDGFEQLLAAVLRTGQDKQTIPAEAATTSGKTFWPLVRPDRDDAVKLDLPPQHWSADRPGARLMMIASTVAAHHDPGWATVSGLRWKSLYDTPQRATVLVRTHALPAHLITGDQQPAQPQPDPPAAGEPDG